MKINWPFSRKAPVAQPDKAPRDTLFSTHTEGRGLPALQTAAAALVKARPTLQINGEALDSADGDGMTKRLRSITTLKGISDMAKKPTGDPSKDLPSIDGSENEFSVAAAALRQFIERVERLEEEKKTLADDIKEVMAEAKGFGLDTKIVRKIIKLRRQDANTRKEEEALTEIYMNALGMV